ncbi:unnamed protein product [Phytophthora lilii]|uniref:Unnamed protein product n=1 Tax=Phytophthora lilii TaxID=2077276 RepID=A0A9W6WLB5_9STRA|nr:unnamed protein product [Phytophthora lilii]
MEPISAATLQKYIDHLYTYVRDGIALKLPEKFGVALDGWSSAGRHFIAIMAVFDDPCGVETQRGMDLPVAAEVPNGGKLPGCGLKDSLATDWLIFTGPDVSKSTHRVT